MKQALQGPVSAIAAHQSLTSFSTRVKSLFVGTWAIPFFFPGPSSRGSDSSSRTAAPPPSSAPQKSAQYRSSTEIEPSSARSAHIEVPEVIRSLSPNFKLVFQLPADLWRSLLKRKSRQTRPSKATSTKDRPKDPVVKGSWKSRLFWGTVRAGVIFTALLIISAIGGVLYILRDLPSPTTLVSNDKFSVSTQIFDRHNTLLYEIFGDENRTPIKISTLPPHVYQASIAIEDQNFYQHFGFDVQGILRAMRNTYQGQGLEGGSTITQQLVKNALLTPERSFRRKLKEIALSIVTELIYTKDEILEMYLNYISYGGTSVGIESAAQKYFKKHAKDLNIAEAALLAGLPQSPTTYSPFSNLAIAKERQREVLRRMTEENFITPEQMETAQNEVLEFALSKTDIEAPHFVFYVRNLLYKQFGEKAVERGGFRVTTTLDLELQKTLQASLSAQVAKLKSARVSNGAALVTKPNTGEILAMIGSTDYFDTKNDGQVNLTLAERQPGSSIKPIMYATAFQNKLLNPGSYILDVPTCFLIPGQKPYCPKNYDGSFHGPVSIRFALANSLNIPAVKGQKLIGLEQFIDQARRMGITTWTDPSRYGLSLTLGGGEVKMIDHAQAFGTLANQGVKVPITPFLKIEDYTGKNYPVSTPDERLAILQEMTEDENIAQDGELERVMNRAPAYLIDHIMQDNKARTPIFGPRSKLVVKDQVVSAKTGTTNNLKDNWTVGFTPHYLVDVWVGNNDGSPMNQNLVSGVTGAAPIFNDLMSFILRDQEPVWQEKPSDVASAEVCVTGFPPQAGGQKPSTTAAPGQNGDQTRDSSSGSCQVRGPELFWRRSSPSESRYVTKEVWIRPETGLPPLPGESMDGLVLQSKTVLSDPLTPEYCVDCAQATTPEGKPIFESRVINTAPSPDPQTQPR